ncbi:MAG: DUF3142 domain-containing protein [Verrucomicrobia bacterium]|nr:DUF3142 domain-containing protein [Verrucomicrobiota bacterium]
MLYSEDSFAPTTPTFMHSSPGRNADGEQGAPDSRHAIPGKTAGMRLFLWHLVLFGLAACKEPAMTNLPVTQSAYIWQRAWTTGVTQSLNAAGSLLDGVVVLGAHLRQTGSGAPECALSKIDWPVLSRFGKPVGLAVRVEGKQLPEPEFVEKVIRQLDEDAVAAGVSLGEIQIDYDSTEAGLLKYAKWLRSLSQRLHPKPLVITALPAWLNHPDCPRVLGEAQRFVLQVHSVPTRNSGEQIAIFEPARAMRWIQEAGRLKMPFSVSLPTYGALLGYSPEGQYLGMALDGEQPAWPAGTRVREFRSDADALARFACELRSRHPEKMSGLFWYRLPAGQTQRNWRSPTFRAVLEGRPPAHRLEVHALGDTLLDVKLVNAGEAEEPLNRSVKIKCPEGRIVAVDALPGWEATEETGFVFFKRNAEPVNPLSPGSERAIGWIRLDAIHPTHAEILP